MGLSVAVSFCYKLLPATITLAGNNLKGSLLPKQENWIWLTTQQGFDVIAQLFVPHNFDVPVSVFTSVTKTVEGPMQLAHKDIDSTTGR